MTRSGFEKASLFAGPGQSPGWMPGRGPGTTRKG